MVRPDRIVSYTIMDFLLLQSPNVIRYSTDNTNVQLNMNGGSTIHLQLNVQGGSDKSGILKIFLENHAEQLKIIRFY